jgi:type IV pilus assembly protein PilB
MLLKANLITLEQLDRALAQQKTSGGRIGSNLARLGYISEEEVASFLSRQFGVPPADLSNVKIDPAVLKLVPAELADKHLLIPLSRAGSVLTIAMANPSDIFAIDDVRFMTGYNVKPMVAPESSIRDALNRYYDTAGLARTLVKDFQQQEQPGADRDQGEVNLAELYRATEDAPVIKLVNLVLTDAIRRAPPTSIWSRTRRGFASVLGLMAFSTRSCRRRHPCMLP